MSFLILAIVAIFEVCIYAVHRARQSDRVTVADTLRDIEVRQATARSYSRPVAYSPAPFEWTERATDDKRAVIGRRAGIGAVWNSDPKVTR